MNFGNAKDWASIISGAGKEGNAALSGMASSDLSDEETKELKKRNIAKMLNQALKRNQGLFRVGQEYAGDTKDLQANAMKQVARGFVGALQGSTG